ncbi:hypothetical protein AALA52_09095 [Lactococcus ileimucosae]|uniref:Uncharacterized protein n=1 Tax=Lactococcus ileimucosae TaxID=2941329 RepID=A0ABV4D7V6_9LACT
MKKLFTLSAILLLFNLAIIILSPLLVWALALLHPLGGENGFGDVIIVLLIPSGLSLMLTVPFFIIMLITYFLYNRMGNR